MSSLALDDVARHTDLTCQQRQCLRICCWPGSLLSNKGRLALQDTLPALHLSTRRGIH